MFPVDAQYTGRKLDADYLEKRARWEPMYEVTQIKGDGEAHPLLSPHGAFADYETWDGGNLDLSEAKTDDMLAGGYAREALKNGLLLEEKLGTNPYKLGMVGSTDSHTALSTAEEDNFFGKHSGSEPSPDRMLHLFNEDRQGGIQGMGDGRLGAGRGLGRAKHPRVDLRRHGPQGGLRDDGYPFRRSLLRRLAIHRRRSQQPAARLPGLREGCAHGGSTCRMRGNKQAPRFMVYALEDPLGANLDRIQIVKGWLDAEGDTYEKVCDVAWSAGREPDADGVLPAVGNTVDVADANWTNTIGASELGTVWADPDFDPSLRAFYYARVIEIPTPRWIVYDAFRYGTKIPEGATTTHQERAYTSPIWYTPES